MTGTESAIGSLDGLGLVLRVLTTVYLSKSVRHGDQQSWAGVAIPHGP